MSEFHFFTVFSRISDGFFPQPCLPTCSARNAHMFLQRMPQNTDEFSPKKVQCTQTTQKKGKRAHPFGFLHIFTAFHTFLTGNSHICKKKRNVSAKKRFGKKQKNGFACNAREFISIKSLQKNKKGGGKTHIHLGISCILQLFTHNSPEISTSVFCKKNLRRENISARKNASAAKKRFRTQRAQISLKFSNHSSTQKKTPKRGGKMPIHLGISHAAHRTCTRLWNC